MHLRGDGWNNCCLYRKRLLYVMSSLPTMSQKLEQEVAFSQLLALIYAAGAEECALHLYYLSILGRCNAVVLIVSIYKWKRGSDDCESSEPLVLPHHWGLFEFDILFCS